MAMDKKKLIEDSKTEYSEFKKSAMRKEWKRKELKMEL